MDQTGTERPEETAPPGSGGKLAELQERVINRWLFKVTRELKHARTERKPILVNTLPKFLDNLAQAIDAGDPRVLATDSSSIAQEHGGERARLTNFQPEDILVEFQLLRECVLEVLGQEVSLRPEQLSIIHRSIDKAVSDAMTSYFLVLTNLRERYADFVSYEIRRPLRSILTKANVIRNHSEGSELLLRMSDSITSEVEEIQKMIKDLLDPDLGNVQRKLRLKLERSDLGKILREAVEHLNQRFGQRFKLEAGVCLGYWHGPSLRRAMESLGRAILNYDNRDEVEVKLEASFGRAIVCLHNPKKVLAPDRLEFIFQSFRRMDDYFKPGSPLTGLPVARGVAEAHGGSVGVDSSREKGTTFILDLLQDSRPYQKAPLTPGTIDPGEHPGH